MSLGKILHPQLIDNLAMGLHSRFNIKGDVKDIVSFLKKFGKTEDEEEMVFSGFPIGKVQNLDHLDEVSKKGLETDSFYNISTGKYIKSGNNSMVYFDGYCVKRNTPEHHAILKQTATLPGIQVEPEEEELEIDTKDGWEIVQDTNYIWSSKYNKIVGVLKDGKAGPLLQKHVMRLKEKSHPYKQLGDDELNKCRLDYVV